MRQSFPPYLIRYLAVLSLVLICSAWNTVMAQEATPPQADRAVLMLNEVKARMLEALRDPALKNNAAGMRTTVAEVLAPKVDFYAASRLVLGKHWKSASAEEREQFVTEFRDFLVRFYASALNGYVQEQQVPEGFMTFADEPVMQKGRQLTLRSYIWPPSGTEVPVDYRLYHSDEWRVFDVSVNGMSLARNYRAGFDSTVRKSGMTQLIADLAAKNAELDQP